MKFPITRQIHYLIVAIILGYYSSSVWAADNKIQPTDFLELAAVMLKDGHNDRALLALQSVHLENKKTDLARFYTLQGLAYLGLYDLEAAKDSLQQAIKHGQKDQAIYIYLAQIHFGLKDYQRTIDAIGKAGEQANKDATLVSLKAES